MTTSISMRGTTDDQKVLDDLFAHVATTIGDVVTKLMHEGRPLGVIGAFFERRFDGEVSGGVGHRAELARRIAGDQRFSEQARTSIMEALGAPDELPIILLVDRGEGMLAVGVRRERGEFVSVS